MSQPPYGNPPEGPQSSPEEPGGAPTPQDPSWAQPPQPPSAASGPYPSYGYPTPHAQPQYGPGPGGPPPPGPYGSPYPAPPPKRRGPIIAVIAGAGVLVLIAVGVLGFFLLRGGATHEATPQCVDIEPAAMGDYVPDSELTQDDFTEHEFWDDLNCEWQSSATTSSPPGYAQVFLMRNDGNDPVAITEQDLANEISGRSTSPIEDIGDEAHSWYDNENQVGCVAAITDNIYVLTCYDAADDFMNLESIDEQTAIDTATDLSRDIVGEIQAVA